MKPLENVRVLEFSTMVTASLAAMIMAEQGASVIKVEPGDTGDPMRMIGTSKGGMSALFANCNRGKQSICLDLKEQSGQEIIHRLIEKTDVLLHNFRPGVMDRLNLGSERLREMNPRLVYVAISGFGTKGPLTGAPAYDPVIQAHAGFTATQGRDMPVFIRNLMCDKITAYTAVQAATAALFSRERSGAGQHIDLSMLDSGLFFLFPDGFMNHTLLDEDIDRRPLLADLIYELTLTRDGAITLSAATDEQRAGVLKSLGREDLMTDPRFDSLERLMANMEAYREELKKAFASMTTEEILDRLQAHHVPAARCHDYEEVLEQPQMVANDTVLTLNHPLLGNHRAVRLPARFAGQQLEPGDPAPVLGEHTTEVLRELGFGDDAIVGLRERGIVH